MLTSLCIYAIKRSDDLIAAVRNGGAGSFTEDRAWVRGKKLLEEARRAGERFPVIFAPAETTLHLFGWALLDEITVGEKTDYSFSGLRTFDRRISKTRLRKENGDPIPENYIRSYVVVRKPGFLRELTPPATNGTDEAVLNLPDEVSSRSPHREGAVRLVLVNAYERDAAARAQCIRHYGTACSVCDFDFATSYGDVARGFIHVHHLKPLSEIGESYEVDPIRDLRPVCPNCHAVLHIGEQTRTLEQVKALIRQAGA